ncbi:RNA-dependent RNA polymerase 1 [Fulvia fulva]|uniref:RNA-directed RNA polymerase n=1 Tax=Passalora fulva TaxID=5499 RepID=A0A9Q8PM11_PASFU|nr:RNA-dependent RNA polymerase 1 [Fulvia fulva]KAK4609894.1 RNA-dependent RNA polymerase 1 [Fulvia fulva]UJO25094.1 RNA-dependent RNA polymerase 1 [Fulvia fulva]WPV22453.1 RNA-dependent RNA polymerase 1 [Fulvia fulva]
MEETTNANARSRTPDRAALETENKLPPPPTAVSTAPTSSQRLKSTTPPHRGIRAGKRQRVSAMAFNDLLTSKTPSASSSSDRSVTPPHMRATPLHARAQSNNAQRRNLTSPPRSSPRSPPTGRPAVPQHRRQTASDPPHQQSPPPTRNMAQCHTPPRHRAASNPLELRVHAMQLPREWTTLHVYRHFERFGNISRIDLREPGTRDRSANIVFRPAPQDTLWVNRPVQGIDSSGVLRSIPCRNETKSVFRVTMPSGKLSLPERMSVPLTEVDFGVMRNETVMSSFFTAQTTSTSQAQLTMDLQMKALFIQFPIQVKALAPSGTEHVVEHLFKVRINPAQVCEARAPIVPEGAKYHTIVLSIDSPPLVYRKTTKVYETHDPKATYWNDRQIWFRQTDIDFNPSGRKSCVELQKHDAFIDIGRWLTYQLTFKPDMWHTLPLRNIMQALGEHNIPLDRHKTTEVELQDAESLWDWLGTTKHAKSESTSFLDELQEMAEEVVHLPFSLRYQLEVCLSIRVLHEVNMSQDFLKRLAAIEPDRAVKVLEKVADDRQRYYNPYDILRLQNQVLVVQKKRPAYCTKIPAVIVTPSTLHFATPVLETSNRVVRQYQQYEDRFLRVKFRDENHKGKIWPADDHSESEVFLRISRAMTHGIKIGDRVYDFLAFGSSQFREHGAYFFASTATLTAADIRKWMGNFTHINVVAKYCARLGQCFSTTRSIPHAVNIEKIPDIERNGHCFTDGAGKISPFLARLIAHPYGLPNSDDDHPSAFQFRLAGCKGVLSVDPALRGLTIQIRPSQQKFAAETFGLEICRISQYSTAYLNMQIILVLSALGVPDHVFLTRMRNMLRDFDEAMVDENAALILLQKNIDYNQMSLTLASMIMDGFMETKDPFTLTCMRLWRAWSLKYLKERARIFVEEGFFGIASPDETGTLRGHYETTVANGDANDDEKLPEIFLQIPDPDMPGKYRVLLGVCVLARNPSLHPGDVRVVKAVDVLDLHHKKNEVILPTAGDRPLANMCSGGDLDGDDFMVIWDKELIPPERNHEPMDYTSPPPATSEGAVTVADMSRFFVNYINNDNLGRIATAHRYWADILDDGVKDQKCIDLANLHSMAVDYVKTGVPAHMPADLKVKMWPHWSEPKGKSRSKVYVSRKVLGQLYDEVKRETVVAAWDMPFDDRILSAHEPTEDILRDAREVKSLYDEAVRRIMAQHGIKTELEVCTTFVLEHHQDINDYKFAETMGEVAYNLRQQHQELCYEKAGTDSKARDWNKMKPFLVAMYRVTAEEMTAALEETTQTTVRGGRDVPVRQRTFEGMPFMSFPWIFARELGQIATNGVDRHEAMPRPTLPPKISIKKPVNDLLDGDYAPAPLREVCMDGSTMQDGELLDLTGNDSQTTVVASAPQQAPNVGSFDSAIDSAVDDSSSEIVRVDTPATDVEASTTVGDYVNVRKEVFLHDTSDGVAKVSEEVARKLRLYGEAGLPMDAARAASSSIGQTVLPIERRAADTEPFPRYDDLDTSTSAPNIAQAPIGGRGESLSNAPLFSYEEPSAVVLEEAEEETEDGDQEGPGSDFEGEQVEIEFDTKPNALDRLNALVGS